MFCFVFKGGGEGVQFVVDVAVAAAAVVAVGVVVVYRDLPVWRNKWFLRLVCLLKPRLHTWHLKGHDPLWTYMCDFRSPGVGNDLEQRAHLCGFSCCIINNNNNTKKKSQEKKKEKEKPLISSEFNSNVMHLC